MPRKTKVTSKRIRKQQIWNGDEDSEDHSLVSDRQINPTTSIQRDMVQSNIGVSTTGQRVFQRPIHISPVFSSRELTPTSSITTTSASHTLSYRPNRLTRSKVPPISHELDISQVQINVEAYNQLLKLPTFKGNY